MSATRFVIYYSSNASPASALAGLPYTHVILSFLTADVGETGTVELTVASNLRAALPAIEALAADGKTVLVSFGGGAMPADAYRRLVGHEEELAASLAAFASTHGLGGVDLDFEVSESLFGQPPADSFDGRRFLVALTRALRTALPQGALITHAPQSPYLDPAWHGGPYLAILAAAGDAVDWITVQYYNNGPHDDPLAGGGTAEPPAWTYDGIVGGGHGLAWPPEKTLVGKPVYTADAGSGYVAPEELRDTIVAPLKDRYGQRFGGLTGWQFSTLTPDHRFWNEQMAGALGLAPTATPSPTAGD